MNNSEQILKKEDGFVLVTAMVVLMVLVVIGIAATITSNVELQISGNEKIYKQAFYQAEGGIATGIEVVEQSLNCPGGFAETSNGKAFLNDRIVVSDLDIWSNEWGYNATSPNGASDSDRFIYYAYTDDDNGTDANLNLTNNNRPHTNLKIGGATQVQAGSSLQMVAGYEGPGKTSTGGGTSLVYDIYAQHVGNRNSESNLLIEYRHVVGKEGACIY